jgi:hypothetical protein
MPICPKHSGVRHPANPEWDGRTCPLCLIEVWDAQPDDTPPGYWEAFEATFTERKERMPEYRELYVQFNDIEEFMAELQADRAHIADDIMRLTKSYTQTKDHPVYILAVVAGAVVRGRLVECLLTLGTVLLPRDRPPDPNRLEQRADALVEELRTRAEALGLQVRAGRFVR